MALISCPECGRERVSDTANSCPGCGYNIAEHFKKSKDEIQLQTIQQSDFINEADDFKKSDIEEALEEEEEEEEKKIETPKEPTKNSAGTAIFGCFILLIAIVFLSMGSTAGFIITLIIGLWIIIQSTITHYSQKEEYELYESLGEQDYIHYKKNEAAVEKLYQQQQQQTPVIICPMCHMPSGEKISATRRVVSTTALGLASSDIGKQYRCKNCGHKW